MSATQPSSNVRSDCSALRNWAMLSAGAAPLA
jgi:hypothetical protein